MLKVKIYNQEGESLEAIDLKEEVFGIKSKDSVVLQVYNALMNNQREPWAHTKNKGEVRGGGKKPWKQKGTGRARHGSIRSPIWKGGGITFGPRNERNYKQKVNKKMNKLAIKMCLSDKLGSGKLIVIDNFPNDLKTKKMADLRTKLPGNGKSTILLNKGTNENLKLASRNLPKISWKRAKDINIVDLLHNQYVVATKEAIISLEKRFV